MEKDRKSTLSCLVCDISHKGIFVYFLVVTTKEVFSLLLVVPDFACVILIKFCAVVLHSAPCAVIYKL